MSVEEKEISLSNMSLNEALNIALNYPAQIFEKEKSIEMLRTAATKITANLEGMPKATGDREASFTNKIPEIIERDNELRSMKRVLAIARRIIIRRANGALRGREDLFQVVMYRYIDALPVQEVANAMSIGLTKTYDMLKTANSLICEIK